MTPNLYLAAPSYTFAERFLGGQATALLLVPYGRSKASVDATLTENLGLGGPGFAISGGSSDAVTGFGDLAPQLNVRWNAGVHNYMTYVATNITVGRYDPTRLANLGIGHNAVDAGGGYTYFNPQTGYEFSAVLGFTYNFENTHTQYQNGVDMHLDLGRVAVRHQAVTAWPRRLCLSATLLRYWIGRPGWLLRIARLRRRPAAWLHRSAW